MTRHTRTLWIGLALLGAAIALFAFSHGDEPSFTPEDLGIRHASLNDEAGVTLPPLAYPTTPPGASERIPRSHENAPPMIPHSLTGLVPITQTQNACLGCHNPSTAKAVGAVPVPPTHYELDLFGQTDITRTQVDAARYACTLCHAPQAEVTLPVNTTFEPEFRNPDGTFASDLMERWEEGAEVK